MKCVAFIKKLFSSDKTEESFREDILATAVLLVEVSYADFEIEKIELEWAEKRLVKLYQLPPEEASRIIKDALAEHTDATSMYPWTKILNDQMKAGDKEKLLEGLWKVAYADGKLDPHEENRIRRLSDLLYMPHSVFIRTKNKVATSTVASG